MNDKVDMIYDLLKTDREESSEFRKEVRESNKEIQERLTRIEVLDEVQNEQLAEHIRRTNLLEELHKQNEQRISLLEEPSKVKKMLKNWLIGIGAIAGAIASILGLLKYLG